MLSLNVCEGILEFIISDNGGEIWDESQIGSQCQTELITKRSASELQDLWDYF